MLQELKLKPLNKKQSDNLAFPLHKKNAISTFPIPQSEILATVKEFLLFTTKDVDVIPPKVDMVKIDPIYYNTSSIPIDTPTLDNSKANQTDKTDKTDKTNKRPTSMGGGMTKQRPSSSTPTHQSSATPATTRVSLLKKRLEAISSYENQISKREKVAKALFFNIESLESKIMHMKRELKKNLNGNYYTSGHSIKIAFEQDKTRTIQSQIDNELPALREDIDQMKGHLLQVEDETENISLVSSKLNTERVFIIEDIKKISKVLNEINRDRVAKEGQIGQLRQNIKEVKLRSHECEKSNSKIAKEIHQLIEIQQ